MADVIPVRYVRSGADTIGFSELQTDETINASKISGLATVATSGSYADLTNKPTIPTDLDSLTDVTITTPSTGQVLKYNGTIWVNDTDSTGTTINSLDDIGDVTITDIQIGQVLKWNGTAWINDTDATGGGGGALNDLTDVTITTPSTGQYIRYNGTTWVNTGISASDVSGLATVATSGSYNDLSDKPTIPTNLDSLTDVTITTPSTNQVLKYNGTAWINDTSPAGATDLDGLTDVTITTPTTGQVLKYNGTTWVNGTDETGGGSSGGETFSPFLLMGA